MFTFRQWLSEHFLILESRLDFLKTAFKDKLDTSHDTFAKHHDSDSIVDHFAGADPTKKKVHTEWLLNQYKQKKIRQEDAGRITDTLNNFETHKNKLPPEKKQIQSYKSLSEIQDAVAPHLSAPKELSKKEQKAQDRSGEEEVHSSSGIIVKKLHTKEASQSLYGGGASIGKTEWCTADKREEHNKFHDYNNVGSLYTIHFKDKQGNSRVHQYHPATKQFMDEKDNPVNFGEFVKKHPSIKDVPQFMGTHPSIPWKNDEKEKAASEFSSKIKNGTVKGNEVGDASVGGYLTKEHISSLVNSPKFEKTHLALTWAHKEGRDIGQEATAAIAKNPKSIGVHYLLALSHSEGRDIGQEAVDAIAKNPKSIDAHYSLAWTHKEGRDIGHEATAAIARNPDSHHAHSFFARAHRKGRNIGHEAVTTLRSYGYDI